MKPTAKLSGYVTLGITLCASWTQAASNSAHPTILIGPTVVGQASAVGGARTQADDLLRRARQAIKDKKLAVAETLISQAEDLNVEYDSSSSRFSDTPTKLRKELDSARIQADGTNLLPNMLGSGKKPTAQPNTDETNSRAVGALAQGESMLRDARLALADGDVDAAMRLVNQARQQGGKFSPKGDTPERVEALVREWRQFANGPQAGADINAFARAHAQNLMDQATALRRYGDDGVAAKLLDDAQRLPAEFKPFERSPAKLLSEFAGSAQTRAGDAAAKAAATVSDGLRGDFSGIIPQTAGLTGQEAQGAQGPEGPQRSKRVSVGDNNENAVKEVQRLMALAQQAKDRRDLQAAQRFMNEAKSYGVPDSAFAPGETRPWQVGLEIDSEIAKRGGVVQARAESDPAARSNRFPVAQGAFNPQNDKTRLAPAGAQQPTPAGRVGDSPSTSSSTSRGQMLYEQGVQALQQQDRESAIKAFQEAWRYEGELDAGTRQQLREKLSLLSEPVGRPTPSAGREPTALESISSRQQVLREKLISEIGGERDAARRMAAANPKAALSRLQRLRERVTQSEVDPTGRKQLLTMVDREINDLNYYIEQNRAEIENNDRNRDVLADVDRRRQVQSEMQNKLAELVEEFNRLMEEGRYSESVVIARQAIELDPDNPVVETLVWKSRFASRMAEQKRIDDLKEEGFHDSINRGVHEAAIPWSGESPIAFDTKNWDEISRKRRIFADRNRRRYSPAEVEIQRSLSQMVDVQFDNVPLREVINALETQANINLHLDPAGMAIEGVTSDVPITLTLTKPITLRSALNLILEPKRLGFVIQNEVLKITSAQTKDSDVYVQVYDVADLVIPIPNFVPGYNTGLPSAIQEAHRSMGFGGGLHNGPGVPMQMANNQSNNMNPAVMAQFGAHGMGGAGSRPSQQIGTGPGGLGGGSQPDFDTLIGLVTSAIAPASWTEHGGSGTIEASPSNLSIVVSQTQEVHDQIADLLEQLRKLQDLQVTIEVRFITLRDNFFERIGVDFDFTVDDNTNLRPASPTGLPDDGGPSIAIGLTPAGIPTADLDIPFSNGTRGDFGGVIPQFGGFDANTAANFGVAILSDIEVFLLIQAANGDSRSNILQAPKVTMFNGQTASVFDSAQRPFVVGIIPVVGDFAVAHQPVVVVLNEGTSLSVQAVVSSDRRFVRMTLVPFFSKIGEVDTFTFNGSTTTRSGTNVKDPVDDATVKDNVETTTTGTTIQLPVFAFTTVTTTVSVPDGGTVLLGGIKRLREGRDERGIPILSKVPYINRLFKNVAIGREAQSLMMMVTPRIIIQEEEENKLGLNPIANP